MIYSTNSIMKLIGGLSVRDYISRNSPDSRTILKILKKAFYAGFSLSSLELTPYEVVNVLTTSIPSSFRPFLLMEISRFLILLMKRGQLPRDMVQTALASDGSLKCLVSLCPLCGSARQMLAYRLSIVQFLMSDDMDAIRLIRQKDPDSVPDSIILRIISPLSDLAGSRHRSSCTEKDVDIARRRLGQTISGFDDLVSVAGILES